MTAASRYQRLMTEREPYLTRAREFSALTLPTLIPPEGVTGGTKLPSPYQSVGALGVTTLAAKITQTLLPPNEPFFRLDVEEYTLQELSEDPAVHDGVMKALGMMERTTTRFIEASPIRNGFYNAVLHLIVGGSVLVFYQDDGSVRVFPLASFVVKRDPSGNVMDIVTKEVADLETLEPDVQEFLEKTGHVAARKHTDTDAKEVTIYTHIRRVGKKMEVHQEIENEIVPGSEGEYDIELCPWLPLRWNIVDGCDYGRPHVETIHGDLLSLEEITKAITQFAAAAAKVNPMVNPNGVTDEQDIAEAENFEVISGIAADVSFLRIDKYPDFQVAKAQAEELEQRVSKAFLMMQSVQRAGERVTAYEIREVAQDIEATIGAVYILISMEFQLPLLKIILNVLTKKKRLPVLPKGLVNPSITTGIDALGRMSDLGKLDRLVAGLRDLYGPEALAAETHVGNYITRRATSLGIDPTGLIKTPQEKQAEQQARMQQEMMMQGMNPAIQQASQVIQKGMEQ